MEAVKFTLSGRNAFFKKPEVNAYYYFTYSHIHKVALLGIFGAILGYGGYAQKEWKKEKKGQSIEVDYPEFYEKLRHIKVSVVPKNERGYIPKKVQIFNNSSVIGWGLISPDPPPLYPDEPISIPRHP